MLLINVLKIWKSFYGYLSIVTKSKTSIIETNIIKNSILKYFICDL